MSSPKSRVLNLGFLKVDEGNGSLYSVTLDRNLEFILIIMSAIKHGSSSSIYGFETSRTHTFSQNSES